MKNNYKEAFCLMIYKCEKCGTIEVIWNSRDGVTPFCIKCSQCHKKGEFPNMIHEYWQLDTYKPDYVPFENQRIFIGEPDDPITINYKKEKITMKNYIGAKIIKAELSNLKEYKKRKYGDEAKINDGDDETECYIVAYPPIGNGDDGVYFSMSPKDVFENAYREVHNSEINLINANNVFDK